MPSLTGDFQAEFADLTAVMIDEVAADVLPPADRVNLAARIVEGFHKMWAGSSLYIPQQMKPAPALNIENSRERRDAVIRAEYDGTSLGVHRLARRYGLSEISVWRLLAKAPE
ncbi:Mor transcription activator family protein [Thiocapsa sp. UBA6158]|jgi:Mor family transcriptional regulator|uniref:Mor transcription activator family protein n=1 Tax=Thiocapsa sp. UBA6158 TaxID=1947692 RepID=UPI0025FEB377|nr:Mor transcription activator family protein [Thiocapsa sp. UBA6158]